MARKPKKSEVEAVDTQNVIAEDVSPPEPKAPRERTYTGSMLALGDRVRAGTYVKGANGQLRASDDVALALESIPAKSMPSFLVGVLGLEANPYPHLNPGQQSMNLRNRLRGAIKAGTVTLDAVQARVAGFAEFETTV